MDMDIGKGEYTALYDKRRTAVFSFIGSLFTVFLPTACRISSRETIHADDIQRWTTINRDRSYSKQGFSKQFSSSQTRYTFGSTVVYYLPLIIK